MLAEYSLRTSKAQKDAVKRRRSKGLEPVRNTSTDVIVIDDGEGNDNDIVSGAQCTPQYENTTADVIVIDDDKGNNNDLVSGAQSTSQYESSHKDHIPSRKHLKCSGYANVVSSQLGHTRDHASHGGIKFSSNSENNSATKCNDKDIPLSSQRERSASITISPVYRNLTEEENKLTHFLEVSFQTALETREALDFPDLVEINDFYNAAMVWFKMFLKFVKNIDDFKQLDIEAQISLLKANIRPCGMLISAFTFDSTGKSFVIQDIKIGVNDILKGFAAYGETTERFIQITQSLQDEIFKDPCLIAILELVLVFSPAWEELNKRKSLSDLQDKYIILLKHYLEAKHSYSREKELFALVMGKLWAMKTVTDERRHIIQRIESDRLDPVAQELFH